MTEVQSSNTAKDDLITPKSVEEASKNVPAVIPRVVIVGAGFGGLQVALGLRKVPVSVTVVDRTNHHLFQPLLYWVATAGLSPADISSPIRHILRKQKNTEVLMAEVTGVDVEQQRVIIGDRSLPYDYLILATGAQDNYFGHKDWEQFAPGLKTIEDARAIRHKILLSFEAAELETDPEKIQELLTFVLVGAGPTGVEMAGAIAEIAHKTLTSEFRHIDPKQARIILIEAMPRILSAFPESLARKTQKRLSRMGVEVRTGTPVLNIDEHGVTVPGEHIKADTIIWSAGVGASPAAKWLNAEADRAGRVKVASDLSVPGHSNIFVIGDTASVQQHGKPVPGVAPAAIQEGHYVASVITQRINGQQHSQPFRYTNKGNLATVGRSYAIVDIGPLRLTGLIAWLTWLIVHIYCLVGFRNRLVALFQWAWTYFTFARSARLITYEAKDES